MGNLDSLKLLVPYCNSAAIKSAIAATIRKKHIDCVKYLIGIERFSDSFYEELLHDEIFHKRIYGVKIIAPFVSKEFIKTRALSYSASFDQESYAYLRTIVPRESSGVKCIGCNIQ